MHVKLRELTEDDTGFLMSNWMRSHAESMCGPRLKKGHKGPGGLVTTGIRRISPKRYYLRQQDLIRQLCRLRTVVIACDPEDPRIIYGFAVGGTVTGEFVVDYVYVKQLYRRQGIARQLLQEGLGWTAQPLVASHWTHITTNIAKTHEIEFDEYYVKLGMVQYDEADDL